MKIRFITSGIILELVRDYWGFWTTKNGIFLLSEDKSLYASFKHSEIESKENIDGYVSVEVSKDCYEVIEP